MKTKILIAITTILLLGSCSERPFVPNYEIIAQFSEKEITKEQEELCIDVLQKRFSAYKLRNEITFKGNEISIKLMDLKRNIDAEGIKKLITTKGKLSFLQTYKNTEIGDSIFIKSNALDTKLSPLVNYIYPHFDSTENWIPSSIVGKVKTIDTAFVNQYIKQPQFIDILPKKLRLKWSKYPTSATKYGDLMVDLHLVKLTNALLDNSQIKSIKNTSDLLKKNPMITISFTKLGKENWAKITELSSKENSDIALTIDNYVFSASPSGRKMSENKMQITGGIFNQENGGSIAYNIVTLIKSGIMPISLSIKYFKTTINE